MPFAVALGLGLLLTPLARPLGHATGLVDRPGDPLRIHDRPVSVLGGVAVAIATVVSVALGASPSLGLVAAAAISLAGGLADDVRQLPALLRVAILGLAGASLAVAPEGPLEPLAVAGLVALVVATANAVNLMDGQDGLVGGLGAVAALTLAVIARWHGEPGATALGLALGGGLLGFLAWNRPPASVFLGNGGAYTVGTLLAALAAAVTAAGGLRGFLAAGAALSVFALELIATVGRRMRSRDPLTLGDRLHGYDLVAGATGSRVRSTILFWGLGLLAAAAALAVDRLASEAALPWVGVGYALIAAAAVVLSLRATNREPG